MPPKYYKEVILFLADVGLDGPMGSFKFVENSNEVMKLTAAKKIFFRPADEIGIFLVGLKGETQGQCTTIFQQPEHPSWKMIEKISSIERGSEYFTNWPIAISEVMEYINSDTLDYVQITLILLLDCVDPCPNSDFVDTKALAAELKKLNIKLLWIGSKPNNEAALGDLTDGDTILMQLIIDADGDYMMMDKALSSLRIFEKHKESSNPWKCDFQMGDIAIPITIYNKVDRDEKSPSFKTIQTRVVDGETKSEVVIPQRDYVDRYRVAHSLSETIPGYMYGHKFIPVPEADEEGMRDLPMEKSFELLGFTSKQLINLEDLSGETVRVVLPDGEEAKKPFYCLVKSLIQENKVAIVRRVYRQKCNPKLGVLFPQDSSGKEPPYFVFIELLFAEDRRIVKPKLSNSVLKNLTEEQVSAVGDLIDSMMLTLNEAEEGLFAPGTVSSPGLQHIWNSLLHRALHPNDPVPPMDSHLKKLIEPPDFLGFEYRLQRINELFRLEEEKLLEEKSENTTNELPIDVEKKENSQMDESILHESVFHVKKQSVDVDALFEDD